MDQGWAAIQITFVVGACGSAKMTTFESSLEELKTIKSKWEGGSWEVISGNLVLTQRTGRKRHGLELLC